MAKGRVWKKVGKDFHFNKWIFTSVLSVWGHCLDSYFLGDSISEDFLDSSTINLGGDSEISEYFVEIVSSTINSCVWNSGVMPIQ